MKRFAKAVILVLIAAAIVSFAVANRHPVRFVADPFINRDVAAGIEAPFFVFIFVSLLAGVIIGGAVVWAGQGRWRKSARNDRKQADLWKREAENLKRGLQAASASAAPQIQARPLRTI